MIDSEQVQLQKLDQAISMEHSKVSRQHVKKRDITFDHRD